MISKKELVNTKCWYPPTCKAHVELLSRYCGNMIKDNRNALDVLMDIDYHVIHQNGRGKLKGYSHNRVQPINDFMLTVRSSNSRETIPFENVVKIERIGCIPRKYK